ncbi:MAG: hypothetical protein RIB59_12030 [Rhodospirillales bacterium]
MKQHLRNRRPQADVHTPGDIPLYKFYRVDLRGGTERRQKTVMFDGQERRSGKDRRQDADWRFSLIRRRSEPDIETRYADPLRIKRIS